MPAGACHRALDPVIGMTGWALFACQPFRGLVLHGQPASASKDSRQELAGAWLGGFGEEVLSSAVLDNPPLGKKDDAVGGAAYEADFVADHDHRHAVGHQV